MAWHKPLSKEGRAARRQKSPDYWKYFASSKAKPKAPLSCRRPCRVWHRWHRCFWQAVPVPCTGLALLDARLEGFRICLRQLCRRYLSVPQLLFHPAGLLLQLWLLQGAGWQCCRQGRVSQGACSTARVSSCSSSMAQLFLYPTSKISCPPEEGPDPVDGVQSLTWGLPLPSSVPGERMGCRWPTWCQKLLLVTTWHTGFHPGEKASIWASLHLVVVLSVCV